MIQSTDYDIEYIRTPDGRLIASIDGQGHLPVDEPEFVGVAVTGCAAEEEDDPRPPNTWLPPQLILRHDMAPDEAVTMLYSFYSPGWIAQFFNEALNRQQG